MAAAVADAAAATASPALSLAPQATRWPPHRRPSVRRRPVSVRACEPPTPPRINADDPLAGLTVGEAPSRSRRPTTGSRCEVRASALNHHDLWSLRGVGLPADRLPMILGCDAAGVDDDGNEVVIYPVLRRPGRPARHTRMLSERYPGTLAERVAVPRANLVPKPAGVSVRRTRPACRPPG